VRIELRGALDLCLVGPDDDTAAGALMYRAHGSATWSELSLAALEYQLLRSLCGAAREPGQAACLSTKALAARLPFHSRYPSEDNVRQLVRRFRLSLEEIGVVGLVESVPNRGYRLGWEVVAP
jgi:DNA-binding response OmpR family regulator